MRRKLARLLKGLRCKLNLIAFNEFPGSPFRTPSPEAVSAFQQVLLDRHYTAILRASHGRDILAACGQLSGTAAEMRDSPCARQRNCRWHTSSGRSCGDPARRFCALRRPGGLLGSPAAMVGLVHVPAFLWAGFIEADRRDLPADTAGKLASRLGRRGSLRGRLHRPLSDSPALPERSHTGDPDRSRRLSLF